MEIADRQRRAVIALVSGALVVLPLACGESFFAAREPATDAASESTAGGSGSGGTGGAGNGGAGNGGAGNGGGSAGAGRDSGVVDAIGEQAEPPPPIPTNGLRLWLRADRGVRLEEGLIAVWEDQSGNNNHAIQTASNVRPKPSSSGSGGLPRIEFDGTDDFLKLPSGFADFTQGVSVFATVQYNPSNSCSAVVELSNGSEVDDISFGQYQNRLLYEVSDQFQQGADVPAETPHVIVAVHRSNRTFELRRNGQLTGEGSFPLPVNVTRQQNFVGKSLYAGCVVFPGQIAELVVYARAVNDAELVAVEKYLQDRSACCRNSASSP